MCTAYVKKMFKWHLLLVTTTKNPMAVEEGFIQNNKEIFAGIYRNIKKHLQERLYISK